MIDISEIQSTYSYDNKYLFIMGVNKDGEDHFFQCKFGRIEEFYKIYLAIDDFKGVFNPKKTMLFKQLKETFPKELEDILSEIVQTAINFIMESNKRKKQIDDDMRELMN